MNGFYVYFDDGGKIYGGKNRRWVYCDAVKGITDTKDFYPLNDFIIDAVHVFNSAKLAQKFIDVDCKYFDEQHNLKISEIPNDISSWYESKKTTKRSLKESKYSIKFEDFLALNIGQDDVFDIYVNDVYCCMSYAEDIFRNHTDLLSHYIIEWCSDDYEKHRIIVNLK